MLLAQLWYCFNFCRKIASIKNFYYKKYLSPIEWLFIMDQLSHKEQLSFDAPISQILHLVNIVIHQNRHRNSYDKPDIPV